MEIIRDLLNYAADVENIPKIEQSTERERERERESGTVYSINMSLLVLPELAASDHLFHFWKSVAVKDDVSIYIVPVPVIQTCFTGSVC